MGDATPGRPLRRAGRGEPTPLRKTTARRLVSAFFKPNRPYVGANKQSLAIKIGVKSVSAPLLPLVVALAGCAALEPGPAYAYSCTHGLSFQARLYADMAVLEAATGSDALATCADYLPEIVVVDARLPDMAAEDLIRRIATLDPGYKPQIILCVTEFDVGAIMRARRAGAKGHMMKPFNRAQLLERFRDLELAA